MSGERDRAVAADSDAILEQLLAAAREQVVPEARSRAASGQLDTIAALRRQLTDLTAQLARRTEMTAAAVIERDGLARVLTRRVAEITELRAELDALESSVREAQRRTGSAEAGRLTLAQELSAVRDECSRLRGELGGAKRRGTALESELRELELELASVERQSTEQASRDGDQIRALRWQIAMLERAAAAGRAERERLTAETDGLEARLERVERRLSARAAQLQAIRASRSFRIAVRAANAKQFLLHPGRARERRRALPSASETEPE